MKFVQEVAYNDGGGVQCELYTQAESNKTESYKLKKCGRDFPGGQWLRIHLLMQANWI